MIFFKYINLAIILLFLLICHRKAIAFEIVPQAKRLWFSSKNVDFFWTNNTLGNGKYDYKDNIREMYLAMFSNHGMTGRTTVGTNTIFKATIKKKKLKFGIKNDYTNFSLEKIKLFGRYNFFRYRGFSLNIFTALSTPFLGKNINKSILWNQWSNEFRVEAKYNFTNNHFFLFKFAYKARYNKILDVLTIKFIYERNLPFDTTLSFWLKKNTYLNKGNNLYAFAQKDKFDLDCFNFIKNGDYITYDIHLRKKIAKNQFIGIVYTYSILTKNANSNTINNYHAFWIEYLTYF